MNVDPAVLTRAIIRRPPLLPFERDRCRWCGEAIVPKTKKDGTLYRVSAAFHSECGREYRLCFGATNFYDEIARRDGERCRVCGETPGRWSHPFPPNWSDEDLAYYTPIRWSNDLEVDHVVPLWKAADVALEHRRFYFLPENMQLLCFRHHREKTAAEAKERAHMRRFAPSFVPCGSTR